MQYNDKGLRRSALGFVCSQTGDTNIINNLRFRWKAELAALSDDKLLDLYDAFGASEDFGNNDEKFLAFIEGEL